MKLLRLIWRQYELNETPEGAKGDTKLQLIRLSARISPCSTEDKRYKIAAVIILYTYVIF